MGGYLLNRDGAFDYVDISGPTDIGAFKVSGKENLIGEYQGKEQRAFKKFRDKMQGWAENRFSEK